MTKRNAPERTVQVSIIRWLREILPQAMIHHSVNEGNRGGAIGMRDGQRNKAMGMLPGFPDLIVLHADAGVFFIEVKAEKGRVSPVQQQIHDMLEQRNHLVCVAKSIDDVREFMHENNILTREVK